jgi:hypothetical protein
MNSKTDHIKFSKNVEWLRPFADKAANLIPLKKLVQVKGYRVPLENLAQIEGQCVTRDNHKSHIITLRIFKNEQKKVGYNKFTAYKQSRSRVSTILETFAHELAHIKHWEHNPAHWKLQAQIQMRFASLLQSWDVQDIEIKNPAKLMENN